MRVSSSRLSSLFQDPHLWPVQKPSHWVRAKSRTLTIHPVVFLLTKGGQLGPIVMEVGGEVASPPLTLRVTPAVSDARGVGSGGYALPHVRPQRALRSDCTFPSADTLRSFRTTGLTMPSDLPQI